MVFCRLSVILGFCFAALVCLGCTKAKLQSTAATIDAGTTQARPTPPAPTGTPTPGNPTTVESAGSKIPLETVTLRSKDRRVQARLPDGPGLGGNTEGTAISSGGASAPPLGAFLAGGVGAERTNAGNQAYYLDNASGKWTYLQMSTPRIQHTVTDLGDGSVLVAGGLNGRDVPPLGSAEVFRGGRLSPTGSLREARSYHAAVQLSRGKALIVGGTGPGAVFASAEVYDAASGQFSTAGQMTEARMAPSATLLDDGRVLIAGGNGSRTAEVFDPRSGSFSRVGDMSAVHGAGHTATRLASGEVLIAGGWDANYQPVAVAELFDPKTNTFKPAGRMLMARREHAALLMLDGTLLISGGYTTDSVTASTETFDHRSGSFTKAADLALPSAEHVTVLLWGGADLTGTVEVNQRSESSAEFYADVLRLEFMGEEVRVYLSARGTSDLREPETSCIFEDGAGVNSSIKAKRFVSTVSEKGRRYEGYLVFDGGSLQAGKRYFFRYSCQYDYSLVVLGPLR